MSALRQPQVAVASASQRRAIDPCTAAVAGLTLLALVLRAALMRDSLMGDELFMFNIVHHRSLGSAISLIRNTEKTPPLFFLLVWASAKIGDPTLWVRLPSVLAATAMVPVGYLLGSRTAGRNAGLMAAAVLALDPFAIFYGTEARAYAAVALLAALSTLFLLEALRTRRRRWWVAYGLAVVAVMYTHYIGVFVLGVQAVWALWTHREQLRTQLIVYGLVVLAYLPWLPSFLVQQRHSADEAHRIATVAPPSLNLFARFNVQALFGTPFVALKDLPGTPAVVAGLSTLGILAILAVIRAWRMPARRPRLSSPLTLIVLLAIATPIGIALVSLRPHMSFMLARNLIPSLVPAAIVIGWLVASAGRRVAVVAAAVLLVVLVTGAVRSLQPANRRTPYRDIAHFIDARSRPGDPIIQGFFLPTPGPLKTVVLINLSHPHPIFQTPAGQATAWNLGRHGADVFQTIDLPGVFKSVRHLPRLAGPGKEFRLVAEHHYVGIDDALVGEYRFAGPR